MLPRKTEKERKKRETNVYSYKDLTKVNKRGVNKQQQQHINYQTQQYILFLKPFLFFLSFFFGNAGFHFTFFFTNFNIKK